MSDMRRDARGRIGARQRRRRTLTVGLAGVAALAAIVVGTTGAYFTSSNALAGQTGTVASLAAPTTFTAQKAAGGGIAGGAATVNWSDAKALPWAAGNQSATAKYTVERSTNGSFDDTASVTTIAKDVTGLTASDTIGAAATGAWQAQQVEGFLLQQGTVSLINGRVFVQGAMFKEATATRMFTSNLGVPTEVTGWAAQVKQIAAGRDHICGLLVTGAVQCWGFNGSGQLGNGTQNDSTSTSIPTYVSDVGGVFRDKTIVGIDAGMSFTCAWTTDGTIGCWGLNDFGQLGNSAGSPLLTTPVVVLPAKATPSATGTLAKVPLVGLATGEFHVCAVRGAITAGDGTVTRPSNEETVVCWGRNNWKQLGENVPVHNTNKNATPIAVKDTNTQFTGVTGISSGEAVSCVTNDKTDVANVACWGGGGLGLLGDGVGQEVALPRAIISTARGFTRVAIGNLHSCGVTATVYTCWGLNGSSQLGDNASSNAIQAPRPPMAISRYLGTAAGTITSVAVGVSHSCLTTTDGSMACWGENSVQQLGQNGSTTRLAIPTSVVMNIGTNAAPAYSPMRPRLVDLSSAGSDNSVGFVNGLFYGWGSQAVSMPGWPSDLVAITAGAGWRCGASPTRGILCSGGNSFGQLGDGTTTTSNTPVSVVDPDGVLSGKNIVDLAAGNASVCALADDGTIGCWGSNNLGQLGNGTRTDSTKPVRVSNANNVFGAANKMASGLAAGNNFFCATTGSGLACWGDNGGTQLGTNDGSASQAVPKAVTGGVFSAGARSVSATADSVCAIAIGDGRAYCWGANSFGQLGTGGTNSAAVPTAVVTSSRYEGVSAGNFASCGWTATEVQCWGSNHYGTLGRGTVGSTGPQTPAAVVDSQNVLRTGIRQLNVASTSACAITRLGAVACWGNQSATANGTTNSSGVPQLIVGVVAPGGSAPTCLDGAVLLVDGRNCSLSPTLPYTYRLTYAISGVDNWRSTPATTARP